MLLFIDQPQLIKVVRAIKSDSAKTVKTRIGTITKSSLAKNIGKGMRLSKEESDEIDATIDVLKRSREVRRQVNALEFPQIAREAMEYFENGASRAERALIGAALAEAQRRVRKFEKSLG